MCVCVCVFVFLNTMIMHVIEILPQYHVSRKRGDGASNGGIYIYIERDLHNICLIWVRELIKATLHFVPNDVSFFGQFLVGCACFERNISVKVPDQASVNLYFSCTGSQIF